MILDFDDLTGHTTIYDFFNKISSSTHVCRFWNELCNHKDELSTQKYFRTEYFRNKKIESASRPWSCLIFFKVLNFKAA